MALGPNFPPDIVQVHKTETPGGGGTEDDEGFAAEMEPNEDGFETAGMVLRHPSDPGNQDCYIVRNAAGDLILKDKLANGGGEVNLTALFAAGAGEANTGSNVGASGVGVFDGKVGVDLRFRKLNPINANNLLTAVLNAQKIDLNVLNDSAFWNALKLKGTEIDFLSGLQNGDILVFNNSTSKFERQAQPSGGGFLQQHVNDETTQGSYTTLGFFLFWGTNEGSTPNALDIIAFVESATRPGSYRLVDTDNGGNVIAEVTGITSLAPSKFSMGAISNLSATQAIWEMQALRGGSGAKFVRWETLLIGFA